MVDVEPESALNTARVERTKARLLLLVAVANADHSFRIFNKLIKSGSLHCDWQLYCHGLQQEPPTVGIHL